MAKSNLQNKEVEQYRDLLERPDVFEGGFGWTTIAGILFCGLIMMPGGIYLTLMTGGGMGGAVVPGAGSGVFGGAAAWVTVILFGEVARRALKSMSKGNLVVLLHAAGIMALGGPFGQIIYRAYFVGSEAVRDSGMSEAFPTWWCPLPGSEAILERTLFHPQFAIPILLVIFGVVCGLVNKYTVGYFLFRVTSDVENLPFPMAPVSAQGVLAMTEMDEQDNSDDKKKSLLKRATEAIRESASKEKADAERDEADKRFSRWRIFSFGAVLGLGFGLVQVGIPLISGMILDKPIMILPLPFLDTTTLTESILPASPTGIAIDLGMFIMGLVLPFWSLVGTGLAVVVTMLLNPIMQHAGILTGWQPGMDTVNTTFVNNVDFWMSFSFGATIGIAIVSVYSTIRGVVKAQKKRKAEANSDEAIMGQNRYQQEVSSIWRKPNLGRGDYPMWIALVLYLLTSSAMVYVCHILIPGLLPFLLIFVFLYNPFISYLTARLLGIAGQQIDIPFIREGAIFLSGAKGVAIWVAPIPIQNFGGLAQAYRINELIGVNFRSLIWADLVTTPSMLLLSFMFWAFIWQADPIPSDIFPAAQINWEMFSKNQALMYSSTFVPEGVDPAQHSIANSQFMEAVHPKVMGSAAVLTIGGFSLMTILGLPTFLVYGFIRAIGQFPHMLILQIVGAFVGKFYFQKKFGSSRFLRMAPTVMAGYFTGVGLVSMAMVALTLVSKAVTTAPF